MKKVKVLFFFILIVSLPYIIQILENVISDLNLDFNHPHLLLCRNIYLLMYGFDLVWFGSFPWKLKLIQYPYCVRKNELGCLENVSNNFDEDFACTNNYHLARVSCVRMRTGSNKLKQFRCTIGATSFVSYHLLSFGTLYLI